MNGDVSSLRIDPDLVLLGDGAQYDFLDWLLPQEIGENWKERSVQMKYGARFSQQRTDNGWLINCPKLLPHMSVYIPGEGEEWRDLAERTMARFAVFETFPFGKDETKTHLEELEAKQSTEVLLVLLKQPIHTGATDLRADKDDWAETLKENQARGRAVTLVQEAQKDMLRVLHWHEPLGDHKLRILRKEVEKLRQSDFKLDYELCLEDWESEEGFLGPQDIKLSKISEFKSVKRSRARSIWDCYAKSVKKLLFPSGGQGGMFEIADAYTALFWGEFWRNVSLQEDRDELTRRMEQALDRRLKEKQVEVDSPEPFTEENYQKTVKEHKLIERFEEGVRLFIHEDVLKLSQDQLEEKCRRLEDLCMEYDRKRC